MIISSTSPVASIKRACKSIGRPLKISTVGNPQNTFQGPCVCGWLLDTNAAV